MISRSQNIENFAITYLLIACSGIPFFVGSYFLMPLAFLYTIYISLKRGVKIIDKHLFWILIFMVLLVVLRYIFIAYTLPPTYEVLVIILKYAFPFIVLKVLRDKFIDYYIKVMYYISIVSIFFFVIFLISPGVEFFFRQYIAPLFEMEVKGGFYTYAPNFILYTINQAGRNHGPFWEAGGYGVFLIIALIFRLLSKRSLFDKYGIVFLTSIVTTFSTATYAALFIVIIAYIISIPDRRYQILLLPLTLLLALNLYRGSEFLEKKVETHFSVIETDYEGRVANRFTSLLLDLDRIVSNPLFGDIGRYTEKEYTIYDHRNNGLSAMAVSHGLIYFFLFFILTYRSFVRLAKFNNNFKVLVINLAIVAIFAVYFGQILTDKPMMNILFMFPFIFFSQKISNHSSSN